LSQLPVMMVVVAIFLINRFSSTALGLICCRSLQRVFFCVVCQAFSHVLINMNEISAHCALSLSIPILEL
jgi:hypothetical protein